MLSIAFFNIRGKPNSKVERLSGGNQQRTQLALLPVPLNLLLMEHPTRGLDIESAILVWQPGGVTTSLKPMIDKALRLINLKKIAAY